jgi:hypothetical protein
MSVMPWRSLAHWLLLAAVGACGGISRRSIDDDGGKAGLSGQSGKGGRSGQSNASGRGGVAGRGGATAQGGHAAVDAGGPFCGDGVVEGDEECDLGGEQSVCCVHCQFANCLR